MSLSPLGCDRVLTLQLCPEKHGQAEPKLVSKLPSDQQVTPAAHAVRTAGPLAKMQAHLGPHGLDGKRAAHVDVRLPSATLLPQGSKSFEYSGFWRPSFPTGSNSHRI